MTQEPKLSDGIVGQEIVSWFKQHEWPEPISAEVVKISQNEVIYTITFKDGNEVDCKFILKPQGIFNIESVERITNGSSQ